MMIKSLKAQNHRLASTEEQLQFLNNGIFASGDHEKFEIYLQRNERFPLRPAQLEILQVNVGYMCNQTCKHCHVDAGPDRKEIMTRETMELCLDVLEKNQIPTLDITGGAPEMNPDFRWFVEEAHKRGVQEIIVRSNLTILLANPKYHDLPEFFAQHGIRVVSSLPYYRRNKTDRQRGNGVFDKSIEALQRLNEKGYGKPGSGLILDLVYNPSGAFLPGDQMQLELDFKQALKKDFDVSFSNLFTITNLPISRFLDYLIVSENYEDYMDRLITAFNPSAIDGVMCRNTISVDWQGHMYDCDFNQMLEIKTSPAAGQHISEFDLKKLTNRAIRTDQHCFGCTAGAGSSCQGTVA
ncbi:arsenosugar biosynthesis radical SAM protein ArsS [bacterium SCSIO 12741]|nr:arsenosugar biosynthesis radical SAM protein ArsS [bacterium SCSIO 12741]